MEEKDYKFAGFWIRFFAFILDSFIFSAIIYFLAYLLVDASTIIIQQSNEFLIINYDSPNFALFLVLNYGLPILLFISFWSIWGATPGKMLLGLKIVNQKSGNKPSVFQSIIRYIGYIVSSFFFLLGFIWIGLDDKKRGWHDMMAKTYVVYKDKE